MLVSTAEGRSVVLARPWAWTSEARRAALLLRSKLEHKAVLAMFVLDWRCSGVAGWDPMTADSDDDVTPPMESPSVRTGATWNRRRRRQDAVRPHRVTVRFSDDELTKVVTHAAAARLAIAAYLAELGVTPPRALRSDSSGDGDVRSELLVSLMGVHRQLRGAANNLNQAVAKWHATEELPEELLATVQYVRRVAQQVDEAVAIVARQR